MAKDSLKKASTPEPFSKSKTSNWVARGGGLPAYIQHIAHDIRDKRGVPESRAIAIAIGVVKRWARGGGKVDANTRAAAAKAVAEWEKLKAGAKGRKVQQTAGDDLPEERLTDEEAVMLDDIEPPTVQESPVAPLELRVETGDLKVLEATAGHMLSRRGARGARTRSGAPAGTGTYTESQHPRGRGGTWVSKGASGVEVRAVQRRVGTRVDGEFGDKTRKAVMDYQRKHGLKVDGIVGRQTVAAMRGRKDAKRVAVGKLSSADQSFLAGHVRGTGRRRKVVQAPTGALAIRLGEDMRILEAPDLAIHEEADLVFVDGHSELAIAEAAIDADKLFNADGTIDFVIIRPCNGRGPGNRIFEADMLSRNAHVFAGWPAYDNHESDVARRARRGLPRPPSELAGEVRESFWDPSFTTPRDAQMNFGRGAVIGRFMLTEDMEKLVRRLPHAVRTSVNADATGLRPGQRNGKRGAIVEGFVDDPESSSVDLVTKAGAGGEVAALYRQMAAA